ncbi:MAG: glycosyltransferase, partial [Anaerolineaceae bacterium]|nr:glycosyltransferase [Anaerolineaceae bacterium]
MKNKDKINQRAKKESAVKKLVIQIPAYNEAENISRTLDDIPRQYEGIDEVQVVVIDDGSTDG